MCTLGRLDKKQPRQRDFSKAFCKFPKLFCQSRLTVAGLAFRMRILFAIRLNVHSPAIANDAALLFLTVNALKKINQ